MFFKLAVYVLLVIFISPHIHWDYLQDGKTVKMKTVETAKLKNARYPLSISTKKTQTVFKLFALQLNSIGHNCYRTIKIVH